MKSICAQLFFSIWLKFFSILNVKKMWSENPSGLDASAGRSLSILDLNSVCLLCIFLIHYSNHDWNIQIHFTVLFYFHFMISVGEGWRSLSTERLHKPALSCHNHTFRKREDQLKIFANYMHPILGRQNLDYGIYAINQVSWIKWFDNFFPIKYLSMFTKSLCFKYAWAFMIFDIEFPFLINAKLSSY